MIGSARVAAKFIIFKKRYIQNSLFAIQSSLFLIQNSSLLLTAGPRAVLIPLLVLGIRETAHAGGTDDRFHLRGFQVFTHVADEVRQVDLVAGRVSATHAFLIQNSSFLMQNSSLLIQNSSILMQTHGRRHSNPGARRSQPARSYRFVCTPGTLSRAWRARQRPDSIHTMCALNQRKDSTNDSTKMIVRLILR